MGGPEGVRRPEKHKKVYAPWRNKDLLAKNHIDQNQQNSTLNETVFDSVVCSKFTLEYTLGELWLSENYLILPVYQLLLMNFCQNLSNVCL